MLRTRRATKGELGFHPLARQGAQTVLPHGEGAAGPGQGLDGNQDNGDKVSNPKGKVADPAPPQRAADKDDDLPSTVNVT